MRKTITLDDDVNQLLREEMRRSGRSFKETVNEALRRGFQAAEDVSQAPRKATERD